MKKIILIVDDDVLVLKTLQNLLRHEGYEILAAKSAAQAKEILSSVIPDLILSDIRMPAEDGTTFIENLKKNSSQPEMSRIPVVFITGYASEEAPVKAVQMGAYGYVLKPFDNDELRSTVRKAISGALPKEANLALGSLNKAFEELKQCVDQYRKIHEKSIGADPELSSFFEKLEESFLNVERHLVESER